jgi:hypothetical protein
MNLDRIVMHVSSTADQGVIDGRGVVQIGGWPVLSSHFRLRTAPHVGHGTDKASAALLDM